MKSHTLKISFDYLYRENLKGNLIRDWIQSYSSRNKIPFQTVLIETGRFDGETEPYLLLQFKSKTQREIFVRNGNNQYPYFEFW